MFRPHVAALEVGFAPEGRGALTDLWERLRSDGHPAPDQGSPPHVSLAAGARIASLEAADSLRAAVQSSLGSAPQELMLDRVGWFPGEEQVVYLAPAASDELIDWHRHLWSAAERAFVEPIDYYAPGNWVPHCTMRSGPGPAVAETVAWLEREVKLPISAKVDCVTLRQYESGVMTELWKVSTRAGR